MKKIKLVDFLFASKEELGQNEIYHYTSIESLYKIVNSRSLRLSSSQYLNDSKEQKIIKELINLELLDKESISYDINRINQIKDLFDENLELFIISFSKHRDLLSQWRGYADNSRGVSIGFNVDKLRQRLIGLMPYSTKGEEAFRFTMEPVIYEKNVQCKKLRVDEFLEKKSGKVPLSSTRVLG